MEYRDPDRDKSVIYPADRKFLLGRRKLTEGSAGNTRNRIRERIGNALLDFELLSKHLPVEDFKLFGKDMEPELNHDHFRGLVALTEFAYDLSRYANLNFEDIIETAISDMTDIPAERVSVSIDINPPPEYNLRRIKQQIENNEIPSPWEVGMLVLHGDEETEATFGEETKPLIEFIQRMAEERDVEEEYAHVISI